MRARTFRTVIVIAVRSGVAAACGGDDEPSDTTGATAGTTGTTGATGATAAVELGGTLVISNWDAYTPENLIPEFEAATGVDVELANHTTNEDIMGKITAQ